MATYIKEMDATDLIGRVVTNRHGAEFVVTRLAFDANTSSVWIYVAEIDDDGKPVGESGLEKLDGWTIHNPAGR